MYSCSLHIARMFSAVTYPEVLSLVVVAQRTLIARFWERFKLAYEKARNVFDVEQQGSLYTRDA